MPQSQGYCHIFKISKKIKTSQIPPIYSKILQQCEEFHKNNWGLNHMYSNEEDGCQKMSYDIDRPTVVAPDTSRA